MRKNLPDASLFIGKPVPGMEGYTIREKVGSGGNALVFRARNDDIDNDIACKVIPRENLIVSADQPNRWKEEVLKANALRNPAVVKFFHLSEWQDRSQGVDCVVMCSEYVNGTTLASYVKSNRGSIGIGSWGSTRSRAETIWFSLDREAAARALSSRASA